MKLYSYLASTKLICTSLHTRANYIEGLRVTADYKSCNSNEQLVIVVFHYSQLCLLQDFCNLLYVCELQMITTKGGGGEPANEVGSACYSTV